MNHRFVDDVDGNAVCANPSCQLMTDSQLATDFLGELPCPAPPCSDGQFHVVHESDVGGECGACLTEFERPPGTEPPEFVDIAVSVDDLPEEYWTSVIQMGTLRAAPLRGPATVSTRYGDLVVDEEFRGYLVVRRGSLWLVDETDFRSDYATVTPGALATTTPASPVATPGVSERRPS